jgi:tRNA 2-thiocytidine biosynthesis protein TtcA
MHNHNLPSIAPTSNNNNNNDNNDNDNDNDNDKASNDQNINQSINNAQQQKELYENNKLEKRLCRLAGEAIQTFNMIEQGDKVMVCMSGGKDSYAMLDILLKLKARAPIDFTIIAVNLDQKQPDFPEHILPNYFESIGVEYHIEQQDTYAIVKRVIPEGKTTCGLCSRLRRGILYRVATELGATKIALGHHRDDILETVLLNLFFGACLKGMPPKLRSDDGKHIVIRPLAYVSEKDLVRYAQIKQFPIIPCNLCGSQPNLQRGEMKKMLQSWSKYPGRIENFFSGLSKIVPSHLMDANLFDFKYLSSIHQGDIAFDTEDVCASTSNNNGSSNIQIYS